MQDKLGPGNSSDQEFHFKNSFREPGKLLCLAKHCWKIADWSDWSYTSWSQRLANFYTACSGCQWHDCLVHGGILFRVVHAACLSTNNSNKRTLQHVLQSVQRPMTDLEMFSWGGVAQALQCLGLREKLVLLTGWGPGAKQWLGTTQVAVRPKQKSKLKQSVAFTIRETIFTLVHTNHVCLTKKCPQIGHVSHFLLWGHSFGADPVWGHTWKPLKYL